MERDFQDKRNPLKRRHDVRSKVELVKIVKMSLSLRSHCQKNKFPHDLTRIAGKSRVEMCNVHEFFLTIFS